MLTYIYIYKLNTLLTLGALDFSSSFHSTVDSEELEFLVKKKCGQV